MWQVILAKVLLTWLKTATAGTLSAALYPQTSIRFYTSQGNVRRSEWRPVFPQTAAFKLDAILHLGIPSSIIAGLLAPLQSHLCAYCALELMQLTYTNTSDSNCLTHVLLLIATDRNCKFIMAHLTGHLYCHTSAGEEARNSQLDRPPDISMLSPELQQQWHVDRNIHLGAIKVKPRSTIKAVWQCNKCPVEQPHIWTASVQSRTRGSQCPYCLNRLLCSHNSLAKVAPEVAEYWNLNKNAKTPEQVLASSSCRAEWECPICGWEWQARIGDRVRAKAGCPKCSHVLRVTHSQPTLAEAQPACLAEWDFERNDAQGIYPCDITLGSGKQVDWICSCCPKGQPHRWTAATNNRAKKGRGCPVCAGRSACLCNSLESLFPSVAAEFDVEKNDFAPSDITPQSHKKVWWWNAKRGSWMQSPNSRNSNRPTSRKDQV